MSVVSEFVWIESRCIEREFELKGWIAKLVTIDTSVYLGLIVGLVIVESKLKEIFADGFMNTTVSQSVKVVLLQQGMPQISKNID